MKLSPLVLMLPPICFNGQLGMSYDFETYQKAHNSVPFRRESVESTLMHFSPLGTA